MNSIVDFHSHVLPGIDDGSSSLEESVAMLRMEAEQGIGHVVATPHFYAQYDSPNRFLARRDEAECLLREELRKHDGLPQISVGAEVYFFSGISDSDILPQLTIGGTGCILIEMMQPPWPERVYRELADIQAKHGITPILAHIDRYIGPFRTYGIPERLQELPVIIQANASFFLHRSTKRMALRMLKEDQIHLLGSDCHNLVSRPPNLDQAIARIEAQFGQRALKRIETYQNQVLLPDK